MMRLIWEMMKEVMTFGLEQRGGLKEQTGTREEGGIAPGSPTVQVEDANV